MNKEFVITRYQLNKVMKNAPQAGCLRFVFVSDLHNIQFGANNNRLMAAIRAEQPDAVLVGGDTMVAKPGVSMEPALAWIRCVAQEYPVYYANGNHEQRMRLFPEQYGKMYEVLADTLSCAGVRHLVNESVQVIFRGIPVTIHGFEADRSYYHRYATKKMHPDALENVLGRSDPGAYNILLAHNPAYKDAYLAWGADLTLSGHCHGGVMRFGSHYGLISPNMRPFCGYCHGMFCGDRGEKMIVSSGLGEHTIPIRIHNPRELVVLEVVIGNQTQEKDLRKESGRWEFR